MKCILNIFVEDKIITNLSKILVDINLVYIDWHVIIIYFLLRLLNTECNRD